MKIQVQISEVAKIRGIKNPYQLQKKANLSPPNARNLFNNNITLISIETLGKLCEALDCKPSDLLHLKQT